MRPGACLRARPPLTRLSLLWVLFGALSWSGAMPALARSVTSGAELQGSQIVSWGRVEIEAARELAFAVLTDYDRMADFMPGMLASEVVSRKGNSVVIEQSANQAVFFFEQRVDARLAIDEDPPRRLTVRALAGSFKELNATYELTRVAGRTLIEYRARFIPGFHLPPIIGMYAVRHSVERHLEALAEEMKRRSAQDAGVPCGAGACGDPEGVDLEDSQRVVRGE